MAYLHRAVKSAGKQALAVFGSTHISATTTVCGGRVSPSQSIVMRITIERQPLEQIEAGALIVLVFEGRKETRFGAGDLTDAGEVAGKSLELTLLHRPPGVAATRVLLAGAG